jgi:hypothetical protein
VLSRAFHILVLDPTNRNVKSTVGTKKGGMSINPGPVDAEAVVLPVIWKAKGFGVVAGSEPSLGDGCRWRRDRGVSNVS